MEWLESALVEVECQNPGAETAVGAMGNWEEESEVCESEFLRGEGGFKREVQGRQVTIRYITSIITPSSLVPIMH